MTTILNYTTDLKPFLDLDSDTIDEVTGLSGIADSAHSAIETYIGRLVSSSLSTRTDTGNEMSKTRFLFLEYFPISSVTSVTIDGTEVDSSSYVVRPFGIELKTGTTSGVDWTVVYEAGYDGTVDPQLIRAELLQVSYEYQSKDNVGASSVSNEGGSVQRPAIGLLSEVKRILDAGFSSPTVYF